MLSMFGQKYGLKMAESGQNTSEFPTKYGFPVYDHNPSVPLPGGLPTRKRPTKIANGNRAMIIGDSTGEVLGEARVAFFEMQEVDQTQFVKIYLEGIRSTAKLTKTGLQVFAIVYSQMRDNPQTDKIELNYHLARKFGIDISDRSYRRGLHELLKNEFLYRSLSDDVYFVNITFMYNGNRIDLAKSYYLKEQNQQRELPLLSPEDDAPLFGGIL